MTSGATFYLREVRKPVRRLGCPDLLLQSRSSQRGTAVARRLIPSREDRYESFDLDLAFHVLPAAATPEPTTVALLRLGVLGLTTKRSWRRTAMKDL